VALHLPPTINIKQSSQAQVEYKAVTNRRLQRANPSGMPKLLERYSHMAYQNQKPQNPAQTAQPANTPHQQKGIARLWHLH
jgi:hypothetical protein